MAGTLTRAQMRGEVLDNLAKGGSFTLQSGTTLTDRINMYLDRGQILIARKADLLQAVATAATIAGQQVYAFPSLFRAIFDMRLEDGFNTRKLILVMPDEMDKRVPKPDVYTDQRSVFYIPYKNTMTFELFPIPDAAYTLRLRYSYFPSSFTADDSVSEYSNLDDALVAYATMYGFRWMQELKDAAYWEQTGNAIVKEYMDANQEQFPDWAPFSEGFSASGNGAYTGEYWNNPFVQGITSSTWWRS